ncbi:rhomboid family intramembrane serine protease [Paenibacillus mucilaginosus]|uniref:Rhomboid family protein n=3 Tax=Paenibacillus mucilaginosus TaxID=61624 RepID=H6NIB7_9BACL|nr:rhomboid family intramembrane serine protease [Paenibacillus mucilaginosus]AEI43930.1 rhomboid family protein [Paenibacillus mucilaginosus KNP414]AFC31520.1 rhomboid family protein [Paenibacillus mucilaginosus 3016]AFH63864.1 rhomboid family protein [Paenibacillus mucilaginosus K02]MCG7212568.1 rhomboid family intramembrane serine protease [Paenibacillus mucilaginosus]WDM25403.1 rhomboid family intramembrane serine protease [Paenibacillus mucilaginosus]
MFDRRESLKEYMRRYPVTLALILVQLGVWFAMEWAGSSEDQRTLLAFGAMFDLPGIQPEPWRYVTAIFIHIGFQHLLFNSFALYVFAAPLERLLGKWKYLLFYLLCGIAGNLASAWLHGDYYIGAGASGAIYGVYAAFLYLSVFRRDLIDYATKQTVRTIVIVGFIYSIVVPRVDMYAHGGGFVGGLLICALMSLLVRRRPPRPQPGPEEPAGE